MNPAYSLTDNADDAFTGGSWTYCKTVDRLAQADEEHSAASNLFPGHASRLLLYWSRAAWGVPLFKGKSGPPHLREHEAPGLASVLPTRFDW